MKDDRLTRVEVETLRRFAGGADWIAADTRARKAIRRLARRGYAEPWGRVFPSGKPAGMRLTRPAHEILREFGEVAA